MAITIIGKAGIAAIDLTHPPLLTPTSATSTGTKRAASTWHVREPATVFIGSFEHA